MCRPDNLQSPSWAGNGRTYWPATFIGAPAFFVAMLYDVTCSAGHTALIAKPMTAGYPACPQCGRETRRLFTSAPVVHYAAAGFVTSDTRFERQLTPERAARFRAQKADAEQRAATGRLTDYEKVLEA